MNIEDDKTIKSTEYYEKFLLKKFLLHQNDLNKFNEALSAESLKILCSVNMKDLDFKSRFELLFNDISMLKYSAVHGLLKDSYLRVISWMIFLECIPFEKSEWIEKINLNRFLFEKYVTNIYIEPRSQFNYFDHPLSQEKESYWNKYFKQNEIKSLIYQDVIRMLVN